MRIARRILEGGWKRCRDWSCLLGSRCRRRALLPPGQRAVPPRPRTRMKEDFLASCSDVVSLARSLLLHSTEICYVSYCYAICWYDGAH